MAVTPILTKISLRLHERVCLTEFVFVGTIPTVDKYKLCDYVLY